MQRYAFSSPPRYSAITFPLSSIGLRKVLAREFALIRPMAFAAKIFRAKMDLSWSENISAQRLDLTSARYQKK